MNINPLNRASGRDSRTALRAIVLVLVAAATAGCASEASKQANASARALAEAARTAPAQTEYLLEAGDRLVLKFPYNSELNDTLQIRPDGKVSIQLIGEVMAAGQSISDLSLELKHRYTSILRDPELTVNVDTYRALVVYIGGEVRNPGVIPLAPGMNVLQAIVSAGGYLRSSNLNSVLIVREQGTDKPQLLLANVNSALQHFDASDNLRLRAHDMVIVPMKGVVRAGVIVQQYINDLLPLSKSFNLNYDFGIPSVLH